MKTCTKCNTNKEMTDFYFDKYKNRYASRCKPCRNEDRKQYPSILAGSNTNHYARNKEKVNANSREYYKLNKEQIRAQVREDYKKNKDKYRNWTLKKNFGIDLNEYREMFNRQNGCCLICNKHQSLLNKTLSVDHCHSTGAIRGLLCDNCNHGIGKFKDSVELLIKAIDYLTNTSTLKLVK